eukprot:CAMPEP_0185534254 /NCGR_PEP_ID=MMETSP1366-20130426/108855_1 /TAXON_ID=38817 /ORGANISM="Gephyrocapsa oceanica, Strain RCC1303" /LENGTH=331 /DNA_ID=CAMNT_0028145979 /DNA_START=37 /DNA_END=1032 /DNA_ORIENTATION=+
MGKGQKMKGKSISLQEFTADVVQNDPSALPTAPREDTGDGYGDRYDRYERREGREGDRFGGRPQSYVNEDGERVEVISQADTVSSWRGGGGGGGGSSFGGDRGGDRYGDRGGDRGGFGGDRGGYGGDRGGYGGDRGGYGGDRGDRGGFGDRGGDRGGGGFEDRGGDRYGDRGGNRDRGGGGYDDRGPPQRERYERSEGFNPFGKGVVKDVEAEFKSDPRFARPAPREEGGGPRGGPRGGGFEDRPPPRSDPSDDRFALRGAAFEPRGGGGGGGGAPPERRKLNLTKRSVPAGETAAPAASSGKSNPFGAARPVDKAVDQVADRASGLKLDE